MHFFLSHDNIYKSLVNSAKQTLKNIEAWLSLVERCVRDAEVASSNLVATTKNTPSHMCEGVFLFLQLFKLTTSNWFGHTVRPEPTEAERRPTRSGGPRPRPTGAEWRPQIQLSLVQSRAERRKFSPIPIITNTVEIFITCWKLNILFTV